MKTQPNPTDLVGFHVTPGQILAAGCCLVFIVIVAFWLSSRRKP
jgi:hypothetical protein